MIAPVALLVALAARGLYDLLLLAFPSIKRFWTEVANPELKQSRVLKLRAKLRELEAFAPEEELANSVRALMLFVALAIFCASFAFILLGFHLGFLNHRLPYSETWANLLYDLALLFLPMFGIWNSISLIKKYWQSRWLVPSLRKRRQAKLQSDIQKLASQQKAATQGNAGES
jgi:hypothetical protein